MGRHHLTCILLTDYRLVRNMSCIGLEGCTVWVLHCPIHWGSYIEPKVASVSGIKSEDVGPFVTGFRKSSVIFEFRTGSSGWAHCSGNKTKLREERGTMKIWKGSGMIWSWQNEPNDSPPLVCPIASPYGATHARSITVSTQHIKHRGGGFSDGWIYLVHQ